MKHANIEIEYSGKGTDNGESGKVDSSDCRRGISWHAITGGIDYEPME